MEQKYNEKLNLADEKSVMSFLRAPTIKIAEIVTGILVSEQKDWKLSAGKLVQSVIKGTLLTQLGLEIDQYQKDGKIKEDYFATHKTRATLYELLKFLDDEVPDEELFVALKSIFLSGISLDATEYDSALAYEFLQTAKRLRGTEILILKANFELAQGKIHQEVSSGNMAKTQRTVWVRVVAKQMGYGELHSIVAKYEKNLEALGMISSRNDDNRFANEFEPTAKYRLTEMGYKFCEYMTNYPALVS